MVSTSPQTTSLEWRQICISKGFLVFLMFPLQDVEKEKKFFLLQYFTKPRRQCFDARGKKQL
jgi:hypothetical protein